MVGCPCGCQCGPNNNNDHKKRRTTTEKCVRRSSYFWPSPRVDPPLDSSIVYSCLRSPENGVDGGWMLDWLRIQKYIIQETESDERFEFLVDFLAPHSTLDGAINYYFVVTNKCQLTELLLLA